MTVVGEVDFKGTQRFAIEHRLGAGGMGVVYRAYDRERKTPVALKTLKSFDAQALYRFKNEFRALADIQHPNLIGLGELICEDGTWFFTMDLVDGQDFLAFVRPDQEPEARAAEATPSSDTIQVAASSADDTVDAPPGAGAVARRPRFDEARLRAALAELALGVSALHAAGKVHRDIKPSNVMVTRAGRVVLLDFGLITDLLAGRESLSGQIVGTPAYMAPEQAAGATVGPAADWYSVGMVLYEALTGGLPFRGTVYEIILAKQRTEPPPPRAVAPGLPADLDALCRELLRIDPKARPEGKDVLERLGARAEDGASTKVGETSDAMRRTSTFVGRAPELAALRDAFDVSRRGAPVTVFVHGESGLGKSELVRHFVDGLEGERAGALVLAGRCYERESVPYKAFDGIVDALSRYLGRIDPVDAALLLPRDAALLAQVFPVLRRVSAVERLPASRLEGMEPLTVRTRAFLALRELLAKLVERRPLVLGIDDFQWADADSQALLREVLRPPEAPALLLLSTTRNDGQPEIEGDVRRIDLKPLSPEETHALVHLLSGSAATDPAAIAREAGGHPLFVQELVRHAALAGGSGSTLVRLDEALWARVRLLEPPARALLEVVAVAGAPLAQETIARAAEMDLATCTSRVAELRAATFVRTEGIRGSDAIAPYHDRVREAVLAHLDEPTRKRHHASLANALEGSGATVVDPNALVRHLEAAGENERAARAAEQAARLASEALAFDRAAEMYAKALRLGSQGESDARRLRLAIAEALANAGRGPEAADAYLAAAEGAEPAIRFDCRRRAAEHLLGTGHNERGFGVLAIVLGELGVGFPATRRVALVSLLWQRLKLRIRGLRWNPRDEREVAPRDIVKLDTYNSVSTTLAWIDVVRSADFQARGLLLALRTGEPRRVARALAIEAVFLAFEGAAALPRAGALLAEAERTTAEQSQDPALLAHFLGSRAVVSCQAGRFRDSLEQCRAVEGSLHKLALAGTLVSISQGHTLRFYLMYNLFFMGSFRELRQLVDAGMLDARRRGDLHMETVLSRCFNIAWLAADEPAAAQRALERSSWSPPAGGYHVHHWFELSARGCLELYWPRAGAFERLRREFHAFDRSVVRRVALNRALSFWLRGRLALADGLTNAAACSTRELERDPLAYAVVWAKLLRAGIAAQSADRPAATAILRDAVALADASDMLDCAAAARRRLGELLGGSAGSVLVAQADAWYASEGVKNPARMTDMLAPGFRRPIAR